MNNRLEIYQVFDANLQTLLMEHPNAKTELEEWLTSALLKLYTNSLSRNSSDRINILRVLLPSMYRYLGEFSVDVNSKSLAYTFIDKKKGQPYELSDVKIVFSGGFVLAILFSEYRDKYTNFFGFSQLSDDTKNIIHAIYKEFKNVQSLLPVNKVAEDFILVTAHEVFHNLFLHTSIDLHEQYPSSFLNFVYDYFINTAMLDLPGIREELGFKDLEDDYHAKGAVSSARKRFDFYKYAVFPFDDDGLTERLESVKRQLFSFLGDELGAIAFDSIFSDLKDAHKLREFARENLLVHVEHPKWFEFTFQTEDLKQVKIFYHRVGEVYEEFESEVLKPTSKEIKELHRELKDFKVIAGENNE